jgi:hypothetical protein
MGELAPALLWPDKGTKPLASAAALAAESAETVLRLAHPRTSGNSPTTGDTDKDLEALSEAEEDILQTGGTNVRDTLIQIRNALRAKADTPTVVKAAKALFTEEYLPLFMKLTYKRQTNILWAILPALTTAISGPICYRFVTRHTTLIHALRHHPLTADKPRLCSYHVGVDGSFINPEESGPARAAGAACFYALPSGQTSTEAPTPEAHILTCTFTGDQTVVNAECNAVTLALQALTHEPILHIGWDHDTGVKRTLTPTPHHTDYGNPRATTQTLTSTDYSPSSNGTRHRNTSEP